MGVLDEYAAEMRQHMDVAREVAAAVHEGGRREGRVEGWREAEVETRARVLDEVAATLRAEVRRGERGAPARQQLTYAGGLRRAAAIVDRMRGEETGRGR